MILANGQYFVTISTETTPELDEYRILYKTDVTDTQDFYCARLIEVRYCDGAVCRFALTDQLLAGDKECAVLEDNILTVILFDTIVKIDLDAKKLRRCVNCDNCGGLERIFPTNQGYIIKGESDIFGFGRDLKQAWWFGGRDIFARANGEECFWMDDNLIHCRDWAGWHYVLDMSGNLIDEFEEK